MALHVSFQSPERTLSDEDARAIRERIVAVLEERFMPSSARRLIVVLGYPTDEVTSFTRSARPGSSMPQGWSAKATPFSSPAGRAIRAGSRRPS